MNYAIIDWFNLAKRYACFVDDDCLDIESSTKIFNRICDIAKDYDMTIIVSDDGSNIRAKAISGGVYKANRNKASSSKKDGFISYTKEMIETAFNVISVRNVEADTIIYLLNEYIHKLDNNAVTIIYSSDSDFVQLLDDDTAIYDWNKKQIVTKDNWYKLDTKLKGSYVFYKNYPLYKSMISDRADNVLISNNYGWKKISKINEIIDKYYGKEEVIENTDKLINILEEIQNKELEKKEYNFLDTTIAMLKNNKTIIDNNQKIIDLSMLETPFVYKVMCAIKGVLFDSSLSFNQKEFFSKLKIDMYKNEDVYNEIKDRNIRNFYFIYNIIKKYNTTAKKLKEKEKEMNG